MQDTGHLILVQSLPLSMNLFVALVTLREQSKLGESVTYCSFISPLPTSLSVGCKEFDFIVISTVVFPYR